MRLAALPLALLALHLPAPALAYPAYGSSGPGHPSYGRPYSPPPPSPYGGRHDGYHRHYPLAAAPEPYSPPPPRRCNPGSALLGAALGGTLGAVMANGPRNRRWALPMGAAVGGILGGVASGC